MTRLRLLLAASVLVPVLFGFSRASAQTVPPGGISLLPADPLAAATLVGNTALSEGITKIAVPSAPATRNPLPFAQALRIPVLAAAEADWMLQLNVTLSGQIAPGEHLFLVFWARNASDPKTGPAEARIAPVIQNGPPQYNTPLSVPLRVGREWTRYAIPATPDAAALGGKPFAPGEGRLLFRLGAQKQVVEIGGIELVDYGTKAPNPPLPAFTTTYAGREANAPWRKEAEARIEKLRKGDFTVAVRDAAGKPLPGVAVEARLRRHAFGFGTAVAAEYLPATGPDADKYRETIPRLFDLAVIENHLKWESWDNPPARAQGLAAVAWLQGKGIPVRGHNLVWPNWPYLPASLKALSNDPDALSEAVEKHIADEAGKLRGQVAAWDVLNEPLANHALQDLLGPEAASGWFKAARAADPGAKLYVNEQLDFGSPQLPRLETLVRQLKAGGAPLDAVGLQCHYGLDVTPPAEVLAVLDRFQVLGLPLTVTEFDMDVDDEQLQADYTRDLLTAVFSHPNADGFLIWGFWEGKDWLPRCALFRKDWTPKPNAKVWEELTQKTWSTKAKGTTANDGTFHFRGFYGDYDLVVTRPAQGRGLPVSLALPSPAPLLSNGARAAITAP